MATTMQNELVTAQTHLSRAICTIMDTLRHANLKEGEREALMLAGTDLTKVRKTLHLVTPLTDHTHGA